jgi:hypothetical protein
MLLTCPSCKTKNFLDPYPFWNFKGTTKCAGCNKIWRVETVNGACIKGPDAAEGKADLLPGFAEKQDYSPISGAGLTRSAPRARKDSLCRPKPIERNVRGNPISGKPLSKDDLVGSKAKSMAAGAK